MTCVIGSQAQVSRITLDSVYLSPASQCETPLFPFGLGVCGGWVGLSPARLADDVRRIATVRSRCAARAASGLVYRR
jgi:hypothetical protein